MPWIVLLFYCYFKVRKSLTNSLCFCLPVIIYNSVRPDHSIKLFSWSTPDAKHCIIGKCFYSGSYMSSLPPWKSADKEILGTPPVLVHNTVQLYCHLVTADHYPFIVRDSRTGTTIIQFTHNNTQAVSWLWPQYTWCQDWQWEYQAVTCRLPDCTQAHKEHKIQILPSN